jgi:hypothetical protein
MPAASTTRSSQWWRDARYRAIADRIGTYEDQELAVLKAANDFCGYGRRVSTNSIGPTLDFTCLKPGRQERPTFYPPADKTTRVLPFWE